MARILLINDEPDLLFLCKLGLEQVGHRVETVIDGGDVIPLVRRVRPDLIGLDWVIPDFSGEEVLRQLKSETDTRAIPVLVISALEGLDSQARRLGADGFLRKPFRMPQLVAAVNSVLVPGVNVRQQG